MTDTPSSAPSALVQLLLNPQQTSPPKAAHPLVLLAALQQGMLQTKDLMELVPCQIAVSHRHDDDDDDDALEGVRFETPRRQQKSPDDHLVPVCQFPSSFLTGVAPDVHVLPGEMVRMPLIWAWYFASNRETWTSPSKPVAPMQELANIWNGLLENTSPAYYSMGVMWNLFDHLGLDHDTPLCYLQQGVVGAREVMLTSSDRDTWEKMMERHRTEVASWVEHDLACEHRWGGLLLNPLSLWSFVRDDDKREDLIKAGCCVDERNERGQTQLLAAPELQDATFLLDRGADPTLTDTSGRDFWSTITSWSVRNDKERRHVMAWYYQRMVAFFEANPERAPAAMSASATTADAINTVFSLVSVNKVTGLKQALRALGKDPALEGRLVHNTLGRSLDRVAIDAGLSMFRSDKHLNLPSPAASRSFLSMLHHFDQMGDGLAGRGAPGLRWKEVTHPAFPQWTAFDHLMMAAVCHITALVKYEYNGPFESDLITRLVAPWCTKRLPTLAVDVQRWMGVFVGDCLITDVGCLMGAAAGMADPKKASSHHNEQDENNDASQSPTFLVHAQEVGKALRSLPKSMPEEAWGALFDHWAAHLHAKTAFDPPYDRSSDPFRYQPMVVKPDWSQTKELAEWSDQGPALLVLNKALEVIDNPEHQAYSSACKLLGEAAFFLALYSFGCNEDYGSCREDLILAFSENNDHKYRKQMFAPALKAWRLAEQNTHPQLTSVVYQHARDVFQRAHNPQVVQFFNTLHADFDSKAPITIAQVLKTTLHRAHEYSDYYSQYGKHIESMLSRFDQMFLQAELMPVTDTKERVRRRSRM